MSDYKVIVTDIEGDNLLEYITRFHCATIMDFYTGEYKEYRPWQVDMYINALYRAEVYINHNIIGFDMPALEKLFGFKWNPAQCYDTLVVSRTVFPDRPGGHSLKALGKSLGVLKGDFGETESWDVFTEDMMKYNVQDCVVTRALAQHQLKGLGVDILEVVNGKG